MNQILNANSTTHWLRSRQCIGKNCTDYLMRCHVLKTMPDGRLKLAGHVNRNWKNTLHIRQMRYVEAYRVFEQNKQVASHA